jgi:ubiquinone/menaquinone biosynthesis C-methylase UbiE
MSYAIRTIPGITSVISDTLYAATVEPDSLAYERARDLQAQRFARACRAGDRAYFETVEIDPERTIPIVVFQRVAPQSDRSKADTATDLILGTARIELPGTGVVEDIVKFAAGSRAADLMARHAVAEIGGFASRGERDMATAVDVLDAVAPVVLEIAQHLGLEYYWVFPRKSILGLLLVSVPDLLPPYEFTLCQEVTGWNEGHPRLQGVRDLRVKGIATDPDEPPVVFEIAVDTLKQNFAQRRALLERRQNDPDFAKHLMHGVNVARRRVDRELALLRERLEVQMSMKAQTDTISSAPDASIHATASTTAGADEAAPAPEAAAPVAEEQHASDERQGFLPFAAPTEAKEGYLRALMGLGGQDVQAYKELSFELLELDAGMSVLDVGCGAGLDLPRLAELVGAQGHVIGLDHDHDLVEAAQRTLAAGENPTISVQTGDAEQMALPSLSVDRVRADRALQHMLHPERAIAEMYRVLRADGLITIIEPDWKSIALYPAGPGGGDGDEILTHLLTRYQDRLPHALIGRQLRALLNRFGRRSWAAVDVRAVAYTLTSWPVVDAVLQLSTSAKALASEVPLLAARILDWLDAIEIADQHGEFFAVMPLFFARARKAG